MTNDDQLPDLPTPSPEDFERLRMLLMKPERGRIEEVERRLDEPLDSERVAAVLPQAIAARVKEDNVLAAVLTPTVERSLEESVQRNPKVLADAIFPIIGPAIRRSISQTIAEFVDSINQTVEHSLTIKGLRWRMEARRSNKSFAEIVLAKSFRYRVEQVFLVHRETGLLLEHVIAPGAPRWEADLVSSMLGAIQDFMIDSFADAGVEAQEDMQLEQIEIASGLLILAPGPDATVAAWVRGMPPPRVRESLVDAVEAVHQRSATDLSDFDGDTAPFVVVRPLLEDCISQQASEHSRSKKNGGWVMWLIGCAVLVGAVVLLTRSYNHKAQAQQNRDNLAAAIEAAPGIFVRSIEGSDPIRLEVLVDPRAETPRSIIARVPLVGDVPVDLVERAFLSADPPILLARLAARIVLPGTVRWRLSSKVLVLDGTVDASWLDELKATVQTVEGIESVDTSACELRSR